LNDKIKAKVRWWSR